MAEVVVGGALLAALFDKLFERLASPEFRTGYKLKQLESKLTTTRLYLDDAENRQLRDKSTKEWLDDLGHVVFQADDLSEEFLDKNPNSGIKYALMEFFRSIFQSLMDKILMELEDLLDRATALGLKRCNGTARSSSTADPVPLLAQHHIFGRDDDKDEIVELLLSDKAFGTQQVVVVPIVGMGGIGKTTLAHLVYNDARVKPEFQLRAWVTVSTDFDVVKISKTILEQISPGEAGTGELRQLRQKMKDALTGKKFLIVLDDVWDEDYSNWNLLKSNFECGALGSRVVVTTRIGEVGDMVKTGPIQRLRKFSREDCWSIFIDHAFGGGGDSSSYPRLQKIGRNIVEKCDGIPLAVMAMGGLLCSTRDPMEWENVLNSPVWDIGENNQGHGVLPALWLSYRYLPSSLKQCFAYSSMFPQDYRFGKKQMVLLWMAEGFLPSGDTETRSMEVVGEQYFDILVTRSLFTRSRIDESKFVLHDLIHDLATFVSGKFCVSVSGEGAELKRVTIRTRHSSHGNVALDSKLLSGVSKAKHLRSFLRQHEYGESCSYKFVTKLITNHMRLRVLSIRTRDLISAYSFCNLKHLRYLNLSGGNFKEVPSSVCTLFNLQTLILSNCFELTQLPTDITKLVKLRHLGITDTWLTHLPPQMDNLKELRTLRRFVVGDPDVVSACSNIKEMQELQHLSGKLRISGLENVAKFQDVGKDILRHKTNLKELVLQWGGTRATETNRGEDKDVLDALRPHTNLEKLVIEGYRSGLSFPIWVGDMSFEKLVSVELLDGVFCDSLPPLGQLPSLVKLVIRCFLRLEKIGYEFYGNDSSTSPFQCLETLELEGMGMLKEWVFVDKAFPCLKNLTLRGCPNLPVSSIDCKTIQELGIYQNSSLECFRLDKFPMLRELILVDCGNLKFVTNDGNSQPLTSLSLVRCPEIEPFPEAGLPKCLTHLRIIDCSKLVLETSWDLRNLTELVSLSIQNCGCPSAASMLSELFSQVLLPSSLASLELHSLWGFKSINGSAFQQAKTLTTLRIHGCHQLESLPEEELPSSLSTLEIANCPLLERKYHKSKGGESYQLISHIPHLHIRGLTNDELNRREEQ